MLALISQEEYEQADPALQLTRDDDARCYGSITLPNASFSFVLCWGSDLVLPCVTVAPNLTNFWVCIDQRVICLHTNGNLLFSIGLNGSFVQIIFFDNGTVIMSEVDILLLNDTFSIRQILGLREIPSFAKLNLNILSVEYIDGQSDTFNIDS